MLGEESGDVVVGGGDELADLVVDEALGLLRCLVRAWQSVRREHGDRSDGGVHSPPADHLAGDLGELLDVGFGAGGDVAEDDLFGRSSSQRDVDPCPQLAVGVVVAVGVRGREGDPERLATGDDGDLAHRVGTVGEHADEGMAAFVVGGPATVGRGHQHLAFGAEDDLLEGVAEVRVR